MNPKKSLKTSDSDGRDNLRKQIGLNCRAMKTALPISTTFLYLPVKIVSIVESSKERERPYEGSEESMKANSCHSGAIMKNNRKEKNKEKDKWISKLRSPSENTFSKLQKKSR
jgi:hypothetical protein